MRLLEKSTAFRYHGYANDTQLYKRYSFRGPDGLQSAPQTLGAFLADINAWMLTNKFKLNSAKTVFMVIASRHQQPVVECMRTVLRVGDVFIHIKKVVCNLGVLFDTEMSILPHVIRMQFRLAATAYKSLARFVRTSLKKHVWLQYMPWYSPRLIMPTHSWLEYQGHPLVDEKLRKLMLQG